MTLFVFVPYLGYVKAEDSRQRKVIGEKKDQNYIKNAVFCRSEIASVDLKNGDKK